MSLIKRLFPALSSSTNQNTREQIFKPSTITPTECPRNKVSIIGIGSVGTAVAVCLLVQNVSSNIAMVSQNEQKMKAELLDLQDASQFLYDPKIVGSTDMKVTEDSSVTIIAVSQIKNTKDVNMVRNIAEEVLKHSCNTIFIILSNPVDILTYALSKTLNIPKQRIIGSGCHVDSIRLRYLLSQKYGMAQKSCVGWVLGEHGDSGVIAWSTVAVGGARICPLCWPDIDERIMQVMPYDDDGKGNSTWCIALTVSSMVACILNNTRQIFSVSVPAKGFYGIAEDVYFSLPSVLGASGVCETVHLPLTDYEIKALRQSACRLKCLQKEFGC